MSLKTIQQENDRKDKLAINLGLFSNLGLAFVKLIVGFLASSSALISEGINSASDTVYYLITKLFLRVSASPPDKEHPYGHRQLENITSIVVGTFILVTALLLFASALSDIFSLITNPKSLEFSQYYKISLLIAIFSTFVKIALYAITKRIQKRTKNSVTKALAADHLNDILTASSASIGILASLFGFYWADPLAGAIVSLFIFFTGYQIIRESADHLMSSVPSPHLQKIIDKCLKADKQILKSHQVRVHTFGQYFVLTMTICLDKNLSLKEGDLIADNLEHRLHQKLKNLLAVHIHYHPLKK